MAPGRQGALSVSHDAAGLEDRKVSQRCCWCHSVPGPYSYTPAVGWHARVCPPPPCRPPPPHALRSLGCRTPAAPGSASLSGCWEQLSPSPLCGGNWRTLGCQGHHKSPRVTYILEIPARAGAPEPTSEPVSEAEACGQRLPLGHSPLPMGDHLPQSAAAPTPTLCPPRGRSWAQGQEHGLEAGVGTASAHRHCQNEQDPTMTRGTL